MLFRLIHVGSVVVAARAWSVGLSVSRTGLLSLLQASSQPGAAAWGLGLVPGGAFSATGVD